MNLFFIVFPIMLLLVAAMAIGVIFGRKPIAGTCGGLNNMVGGGTCEICGGNPQRCDAETPPAVSERASAAVDAEEQDRRSDLAHDATRR